MHNDAWRTAQPETEVRVKIEPPAVPLPPPPPPPSAVIATPAPVKIRKKRKQKGTAKGAIEPAELPSRPLANGKAENHLVGRVKIMGKRKRTKSDKVRLKNLLFV